LAVAYVKTEHAAPGTELKIEMLGKRRAARLIPDSPWDPENKRLRA
jgi:dimethylglycine dehydrogenase